MFYIFALLSASSFRSPTSNSIGPDEFGMDNIDSDAGTATLWMKFNQKTDIVADKPIVITFVKTPILDKDNPVLVEITIPEAVALGDDLNYTHIINDIGESLLFDTMYSLYSYQHNSEDPAVDLPSVEFFIEPKKLGVQIVPITQTKYALECNVKYNVKKDTKIPITFTAGDVTISPTIKIAKDSKAQTVDLDIVTAAAEGKFLAGTAYTISCEGYTPSETTFTPADNSKLTGESALVKAGEKEDGAKDKVTVTLRNALLPAEAGLPEGYTQKLSLFHDIKVKANREHTLDKSDKFKWTHAAGSVAVEYLFNDCQIGKGSTVNATLVISPDLTFTDQPITYAAGAKSVASVVAALFAVISFVF
ncbi:hypothetical protein BLNAU_9787 [Blattamonas nauphoetae]|uniref:Uncharacterized protein n=1 Tax=Blattamonas nauphoetae TaxID=2049346 RepID=A0ABQ9XUU0_9EUKA|nr:hypothetical protein BLNAU_9787 [Blattamonas nauphoetae]